MKDYKKIICLTAAVCLLGTAVVCGYRIYDHYAHEAEQTEAFEEIAAIVEQAQTKDSNAPEVPLTEEENVLAEYGELFLKNTDMVGWLSIVGTTVNYPVMQTPNEPNYYLKRSFEKQYSDYGVPYVQENCDLGLSDNCVIYGHHMRNNMLFAQLENYMTIEGFSASPVIEFNTAYNNYKWKVYAVFVTNDVREDDNGYLFNYIVPNFHTRESFESYIAALDERKLYDTGVDITADDKILTLSTCSYEFDGARLVVVARMVRDGESEEVDVTKAVANENPRYPQKWYDVNGLSNPYRDAYRWEPNQ